MTLKHSSKKEFLMTEGCPQHLLEVTKGILKKCGGTIAIITIAIFWLIAGTDRGTVEHCAQIYSWNYRRGTVDDMRKILSFSYHDLPPHLEVLFVIHGACFQKMIILEGSLDMDMDSSGFCPAKKQKKTTYLSSGKRCFNELINRSMVQL